MKILITGASGMVGRNLQEHAAASQYQLLTPDSKSLNLLNQNEVDTYFSAELPDLIIHSAGVVGGIQANMAQPVKFFYDNMQIALNVINGAQKSGIPRLINLGSSCMYPRDAVNPLTENAILAGELEPTNEGYALAKIAAARLCDYISSEHSRLHYKTLIPCNLYGRHDKFGALNAHMIPSVIAKIHHAVQVQADSVEIWGSGEARREFMYASDLADFIFTIVDKMESLPNLINVGLGHDFSINEYYQMIAHVLGYKGTFEHDLSKPVGMKQKLVDISNLASLSWSANTDLRQGIQKTYQFYLEEKNND